MREDSRISLRTMSRWSTQSIFHRFAQFSLLAVRSCAKTLAGGRPRRVEKTGSLLRPSQC